MVPSGAKPRSADGAGRAMHVWLWLQDVLVAVLCGGRVNVAGPAVTPPTTSIAPALNR
jgi:hypothetical protein